MRSNEDNLSCLASFAAAGALRLGRIAAAVMRAPVERRNDAVAARVHLERAAQDLDQLLADLPHELGGVPVHRLLHGEHDGLGLRLGDLARRELGPAGTRESLEDPVATQHGR